MPRDSATSIISSYRHAAPSGPWPWMDFDTDSDITLSRDNIPASPGAAGQSWRGYPEALFGNWKPDQVKRSKMLSNCSELDMCSVHWLDVLTDGTFTVLDEEGRDQTTRITPERLNEFWGLLQTPRPANIRVRALFVDNLSMSVLQMLGTRYNIEPFFFSSSLNWIPSHYQEGVQRGKGDHITVTLPFMRAMQNPVTRPSTPIPETPGSVRSIHIFTAKLFLQDEHEIIDTQAPLSLSCGNIILLDLLAIHMVRSEDSSTIISYHPSSSFRRPSPKKLHSLIYRAGQSNNRRLLFWLIINTIQESQVLLTNNIDLTRKLHIIQAHLLHYHSLLQDFQKSVEFLHKTPNPALDSDDYSPNERKDTMELMAKECANLLSEIGRLENRRLMLSSRLKNATDLAFAIVNINDSKQMKALTEATVRDSGAMKQISYLTMIFLPASFTAAVFGMNVDEISGTQGQETLVHYVAVALALTCATSWLMVAFHSPSPFVVEDSTLLQRAGWPVFYLLKKFNDKWREKSLPSVLTRGFEGENMFCSMHHMHLSDHRAVTSHAYNLIDCIKTCKCPDYFAMIGLSVTSLAYTPRTSRYYSYATCGACPAVSSVLLFSLFLPTDALPRYRHAAPSGPWPWMDFEADSTTPTTSIEPSWRGYPRNQFGNWTPDQVGRSKMLEKCLVNKSSTIYWMDVRNDGSFASSDMGGNGDTMVVGTEHEDGFWDILQGKRPENIRVRSIFVDSLTSPVLRMLGTKYNIEPFFFTSSINWIPSRYQEAPIHNEGDHITVVLPFVRTLRNKFRSSQPAPTSPTPLSQSPNAQINTQAPFPMSNGDMLFIDLLAIHMVRGVKTSTVISYHPDSTWCRTSAKRLHSLMQLVGGSVYWQKIFEKSEDPTFYFIAILWYALYAWDESFELLYKHVSELEAKVLQTNNMELTRDLHILQAHLLQYQSLLHHFEVSVQFVASTHNPAMESSDEEQHKESKDLMERESENLLSEIDRLIKRREMLSNRLKNVMDLAFAIVNIDDSKQTRKLTEATVRDSAAMKLISYLTMVFLPASLLASVFGMNVMQFNQGSLQTLDRYVESTISLTAFTIYIVITLQTHSSFHEHNAPILRRAIWPVLTLWKIVCKTKEKIVRV
ncbi:hypothetical protein DFJ58DRAFT_669005 [Suillus subalutaceus]|uniref:uncharacterized protein n=1 Tax=Suillus subalutaceus TaxID=48586 RepID=UPI001B867241|nr:uncharacterized protein DFJ58DRAFT_669005 [Suillus subalutaceus]KAG1837319.1 hypothetical protein DFJ58DRAFT_669005 [Suillus subalutaceus]